MKNLSHDTTFLADLVLLRNDPELFNKVLPLAKSGNPHAQYALGLIYAEGRGTDADIVQAYIWLSHAVSKGDKEANLLRNIVVDKMTKQEIASAERILANQIL